MKRKIVESSNIKSVGHDGQVLEVEFKSGDVYEYANVPSEVYESFVGAESIGKFFFKEVKGKFDYTKTVTAPKEA